VTQDELKRLVAEAAVAYVPPGTVIGVGSGSTVNLFIDALARLEGERRIAGAVSSSAASTARLVSHGIAVVDAGDVESLPVCVDGADEIDGAGCMIKGGGAALTREKIVADLAERFVCIADASKLVGRLGRFPLPVEVIPMAAAQVARRPPLGGGGRVGHLAEPPCGRVAEADQQRQQHVVRHQRRAPVADERQGDAGERHQLDHAGDDDERLHSEARGEAHREQLLEGVVGAQGDADAGADDEHERHQHAGAAEQTELLADR